MVAAAGGTDKIHLGIRSALMEGVVEEVEVEVEVGIDCRGVSITFSNNRNISSFRDTTSIITRINILDITAIIIIIIITITTTILVNISNINNDQVKAAVFSTAFSDTWV